MVCEMCGRSGNLVVAEVEGVDLKVCPGCAKHGVVKKSFTPRLPAKRISEVEYKVVDNFAALLKSARGNRSQEDFSKYLNERESVVAKWEGGSLRPRVDVARRIGRLLRINLVARDSSESIEVKQEKSDELTLGDFVKVRKRK
jgi:uncharacterized protein (TIGR00270 family)